ncbi:MAG: alpha/beta hydrolase [Pseudomonadota bacterium]
MSTAKSFLTGAEGNALAITECKPADAPKATVLLLHGGGQTRHSWAAAGERLAAEGYRAIAMDARGHGESEWLASKNYRMSDMAADLEVVANELASDAAQLVAVGASMGGLMTMLVNARNPNTFAANVFVDITPRMQAAGVNRIMTFMAAKADEGFGSVEEAADAIADYMPSRPKPTDLSGLSKNLRQRDNGRFYWHWDPAFAIGPDNIVSQQEEAEALLAQACKSIIAPTLLIRGARSDLVSTEDVAHFRSLVAHAEYEDISDAGHMIVGDRNDVFTAAVVSFLERTLEPLKVGA